MNRLLVLAMLLSACGEPVPAGPGTGAPKKAPVKVEGADAASAAAEEYYYNPAGKRDPFQSFIKRGRAEEIRADAPPLQRWDIDKYTLKGVIWNTSSPRGLLIDPEATGHSIVLGTYVGRNWGKVTSISEGCVVVTEEYQTLDGELVVNPVTVCFPTEARK
ncbi:MAG: pilus assembly protein PilP [Pseudomonadota bacterium]|nr:pilus assembly protein PilP [Pseudomonadota bacterium]